MKASFLSAALAWILISPTPWARADTNPPAATKAPTLTTPQAIKQTWLDQCNPNLVSDLDRNVVRKRWVLTKKAERIRCGILDALFLYQAHLKNAEAYRAVGDTVKANEETAAASALGTMAFMAQSQEESAYTANIEEAKAMSQAPGGRR